MGRASEGNAPEITPEQVLRNRIATLEQLLALEQRAAQSFNEISQALVNELNAAADRAKRLVELHNLRMMQLREQKHEQTPERK